MRTQASSTLLRVLAPLALLCAGPARALYTQSAVVAYRVPDGALAVDGKPDTLWRSILAQGGANTAVFQFQDYSKMVILQPDSVRNADPREQVPVAPQGSATLLAAYDSQALYFFFLVRTKAVADPVSRGCKGADLWKTDAAEVYVDPSAWSADPLVYHSYFTADAGGLAYGTSPRTIQVDKPLFLRDSLFFYRDRKSADRFQSPATLPKTLKVATARSPADSAWAGVEMRIPFWSASQDFAQGKRMFIAWGYNMYLDTARAGCDGAPLAYRWAKNYLNYDQEPEKPPGWREKDSTHYDPSRSWDGWGQLFLNPAQPSYMCRSSDPKPVFEANWDPAYWGTVCNQVTTGAGRAKARLDAAGMPVPSRLPLRDARGRRAAPGAAGFAAPDRR